MGMNETLFTRAPHNGTDTSIAAARSLGDTAQALIDLGAWMHGRGRHGATDFEIQEHFGWSGDFERPRRIVLCERRLIVKTDQRRPSPSGRSAAVFVHEAFNVPA